MDNAEILAEEEQERRWYVHWLLIWNQGPDVELDELLELSTWELGCCFAAMQESRMLGNVEWGAENAVTASPEQREAVLDAIVGFDTGGCHLGIEPAPLPSAGGCLDEAPIFWAVARRNRLKRLSAEDLAIECRELLAKHAEVIERRKSTMAMAHSAESQRKRDLVSLRYGYTPSLIEAARRFRQQGISAKAALRQLSDRPFKCIDGTTIALDGDKVVVTSGGRKLTAISQAQFVKHWWPKGRLPPTP